MIVWLVACVLLPFSGCAAQQEQSEHTSKVNEKIENPLNNLETTYFSETEKNPVSIENLEYDIQTGHFLVGTENSNRIELYYPQIDTVSALPDGVEQSIWLEQIKSDFQKTELFRQAAMTFYMEQTANMTEEEMNTEQLFVDSRYRIQTANSKIISAVYQEGVSRLGRPADYSAVGITVSLAENRALQINEMITDFDALLTLLETDQFTPIPYFENETMPFHQLMQTMPYMREEIVEILKNNNKRAMFTETEEGAEILWENRVFEWYLWDNQLVIVYIEDGYNHQYSIELEKIREIIEDSFYQNYIEV